MMQQLSAQDAQFLYIQNESNRTHVMGVYIYDPSTAPGGKVRFKDILAHMQKRIHVSPVFRRKLYRLPLDIDHPYWVDDEDFDIETHIFHARLPEPGDWRQFCIMVARHFSRPMDMHRPLWDMFVVEGLDRLPGVPKGSYALLHRTHHCAIDGTSALQMFLSVSDADPFGTPVVPLPEDEGASNPAPSIAKVISRAIETNMNSPVKFMQALAKLTPTMVQAAQKNLTERQSGSDSAVPQTRFNVPVSPHKMFEGFSVPLEDFKGIRKLAEGSTINDVVLAIVGGGLRRYLEAHNELPDTSLVAVAPVNLRKSASEAKTPGNKISAMTVKLSSDIADPVERLNAVCHTTRETKQAKTGLSARVMTDLTQHIPGATMAAVARIVTSERFAPRQTNLFVSNVPGPQHDVYMNGARLVDQYGLGPLAHNMGLFVAALSYKGNITFSITSERKIMPDIEFFRQCLQAAFEEYRELAKAAPTSPPVAKARTRKPAPTSAKPKSAPSRPRRATASKAK